MWDPQGGMVLMLHTQLKLPKQRRETRERERVEEKERRGKGKREEVEENRKRNKGREERRG